jgi:hypothetical protein
MNSSFGRVLLFFLLPLFFVAGVSAEQDSPEQTVLFIKTTPINAFCFLDNELQQEKTPLLLKNIPQGTHAVTFFKKGYKQQTTQVTVESGKPSILEVTLEPEVLMPRFPDNKRVMFNETDMHPTDTLFQFPDGTYSIKQERDVIKIDPVYPHQDTLTGLHVAVPVLAGLSALLTVHDVISDSPSSLYFSPATITMYLLTAGATGFDIALLANKERFMNTFPVRTVDVHKTEYAASHDFARAEELLSVNRIPEALRIYMQIIENQKDSLFYPRALYKIGRIHNIQGKFTLSRSEFKVLKQTYPLPDLYDKACKNLADLYYRDQAYEKSIANLDDMVYIDPLYSRENIDFYRCEILEQWYNEDNDILPKVVEAYSTMVEHYPDSENRKLYQLRLAYFLMLAGEREKAEELYEQIQPLPEGLQEELWFRMQLLEEKGLI